MADANGGDEIAFNTPVGAIKAHGFNVVVILALVILSWLTFTEHERRSSEHDEMMKLDIQARDSIISSINYQACLQRLNLYVASAKDPTALRLNNLPADLWTCMPKFLTEEAQERRKQGER